MSRLKMAICMVLVVIGFSLSLPSCGDTGCVTYCAAGTIVGNNCQLVTVCDVCDYDLDCCYGFDNPDCGLTPYPW